MYKVELPVRYILATNEVCSLSDWDFNTVKVDLSESCSLNFKASEFSMTIDNNEISSLSENGNVYLRSDKELPSEPRNQVNLVILLNQSFLILVTILYSDITGILIKHQLYLASL